MKLTCTVDGKKYTIEDIMEITGCRYTGAIHRIKQYRKGKLSPEQLFQRGRLKTGGYCETPGNEEFRSLSDKESTCKPIDCTPGTWEAKHIKEPKLKPKSYIRNGTERVRESTVYVPGQFRVAL